MKIRTIICFIFSILGLLALVAYFFPEDGIAVGSVRMKFPSMTEVLQTEEEKETLPTDTVSTDTLSTEELLQMRMDALKAEKESEFMTYCETNAARIYMPGDNIDYLDPFFDALEAARERPVRIMHYGDSQLAGERLRLPFPVAHGAVGRFCHVECRILSGRRCLVAVRCGESGLVLYA